MVFDWRPAAPKVRMRLVHGHLYVTMAHLRLPVRERYTDLFPKSWREYDAIRANSATAFLTALPRTTVQNPA